MTRQLLPALALATVMALAGCSGSDGGGDAHADAATSSASQTLSAGDDLQAYLAKDFPNNHMAGHLTKVTDEGGHELWLTTDLGHDQESDLLTKLLCVTISGYEQEKYGHVTGLRIAAVDGSELLSRHDDSETCPTL